MKWIAWPRPLSLFVWVLVSLTALCVAGHFAVLKFMHEPIDPASVGTFSGTHLWDLNQFGPLMPYVGSYQIFHVLVDSAGRPLFPYPAAMILPHELCYFLGYPHFTMYCWMILIFLTAGAMLAAAMVRAGLDLRATVIFLAIASGISYPLWFEVKNGNMELFVFASLGAAMWSVRRQRWTAAAILIGVATALKIYPAVLLALLISRRRYKEVAVSLVTAILLTVLSLRILTPSILYSWREVSIGIAAYNERMITNIPQVIGFDHSLFGLGKIGVVHLLHHPVTKAVLLSYLIALACVAVPAYFLVIRKLPLLNQMVILFGVCTFLSPCSYSYTLIELYIPWAALVLLAVRERNKTIPGLSAMLVCFACMVAPYSEFIVHRSLAGQVRALFIPAFFYLAFRYRFPYFEVEAAKAQLVAALELT